MGIITVSRTYGSGGAIFAQELARRMNYQLIDRQYVNNFCEISKEHVCMFGLEDEVFPTFLDKIKELMANRSFYKVALMANIYDFALKNNVVFMGMGGHLILSGVPNTINLKIVRLLSERVEAIAQIKGIPYHDAFDIVSSKDKERHEFVTNYFSRNLRNVNDPILYHLTINSSYVSLERAIEMVSLFGQRYFTEEKHDAALAILKNRLLEKRAEILLFRLGIVHDYGKVIFEVNEEGILVVKGVIGGKHEKKRLFEALKNIKEIKKIEDHVKIGIFSRVLY